MTNLGQSANSSEEMLNTTIGNSDSFTCLSAEECFSKVDSLEDTLQYFSMTEDNEEKPSNLINQPSQFAPLLQDTNESINVIREQSSHVGRKLFEEKANENNSLIGNREISYSSDTDSSLNELKFLNAINDISSPLIPLLKNTGESGNVIFEQPHADRKPLEEKANEDYYSCKQTLSCCLYRTNVCIIVTSVSALFASPPCFVIPLFSSNTAILTISSGGVKNLLSAYVFFASFTSLTCNILPSIGTKEYAYYTNEKCLNLCFNSQPESEPRNDLGSTTIIASNLPNRTQQYKDIIVTSNTDNPFIFPLADENTVTQQPVNNNNDLIAESCKKNSESQTLRPSTVIFGYISAALCCGYTQVASKFHSNT